MPRAFFFSSNCSRPIVFEGRDFKFVPLSILGGRISGVFDSEDEGDITILRRAVAAKRGITEIDEAEAARAQKKIRQNQTASVRLSSDVLPPRVAASPAGALLPMVDNAAAGFAGSGVKNEPQAPRSTEITLPTITSLARTGRVKPPQPFVAEGKRMEIRGRKA